MAQDPPKPIVIATEGERREMVAIVELETARKQTLNEVILTTVNARFEFNRKVKAFWDIIVKKYNLKKDSIYTFNEKTGEISLSPQNKPKPIAPPQGSTKQ